MKLPPWLSLTISPEIAANPDLLPAAQEIVKLARRGFMIFGTFAVLLGGWAHFSPLDSAVVAYGSVGSDSNRKVVQHMDGGIVAAINVSERSFVKEGDELMRLESVQARAILDIQTSAVTSSMASVARLEAELAGRSEISFPTELLARQSEPEIEELLVSHLQMFAARRAAYMAQAEALQEQIEQSLSQIKTYEGSVELVNQQLALVMKELNPKQELYDKGYATNSPVLQLQRLATTLTSQRQEAAGNIARLKHSVAQLQSQKAQLQSDQRLKTAQELDDARNKLADARDRQRSARDVLERTSIKAPATGYVLGLTVHTVGAVIGRGEKIAEIVSADGAPVITAKLRPVDGVDVSDGMPTELRILTPQGRKLPMIKGNVLRRSADVRLDNRTGSDYFEIEVGVDPRDLNRIADLRLTPGTPVEVIIPTGSRSALEYMSEPLMDSFRRGLREK